MDLLWQKSNVTDKRLTDLTEEVAKTVSKLELGIRVQQITIDALAKFDTYMFQAIAAYGDYENNFVQIKNAVKALIEREKLDVLLISVKELENLLTEIRENLKKTIPSYSMAHETAEYYFRYAKVAALRKKNRMAIHIPIPLVKTDQSESWDLFSTEVIDVPIDNRTNHTTRIIDLKEFYLMTTDKMRMVEYNERPEIKDQMIDSRGILIKTTMGTCIRALITNNKNATKRDCKAVMTLENLRPRMILIKQDKVLLSRIKEYSVELVTGEITKYHGCIICYISVPCMSTVKAHEMVSYMPFIGCLKAKNTSGVTWHVRNEHILDHMFRPEELVELSKNEISLEPLEVDLPELNFEKDEGQEILAHDREHRISLQKLDGSLRDQRKLYRTAESKLRDEIKAIGRESTTGSIFKNWMTYAIGILGCIIVIVIMTVYCKFRGASSLIVLVYFATTAYGKKITHGLLDKQTEMVEIVESNETNNAAGSWTDIHIQVWKQNAFFPTIMSLLMILVLAGIGYQIYKLRKNNRALQIKVFLLFSDNGERTEQILWRKWPLAIYEWYAEKYLNEHSITWKKEKPILYFRWETLECKNFSRKNIKLMLPDRIKISYLQAYNLKKIFKGPHQCSIVSIDASGVRSAVKIVMRKGRQSEEVGMQINNIGNPTGAEPSAPEGHNNLSFYREEWNDHFGKVYHAD